MNNLEKLKKDNKELWYNLVVAVETKNGLIRVGDVKSDVPTGIYDFCKWAEEKEEQKNE